MFEVRVHEIIVTLDEKMDIADPPLLPPFVVDPLVNVMSRNDVVVVLPVSTMTTRLALTPSNVQVPVAVPTAHEIVIALVMHSDVASELELPVHDAPVYAVADGVREMVSPTAALLYAANKF